MYLNQAIESVKSGILLLEALWHNLRRDIFILIYFQLDPPVKMGRI